GYSLPDDLLSGTGIRVIYSIVQSIPLVGPWLVYALWDGRYPGDLFITRLFVIHEFLFPAIIVGLFTVHLMIIWRQKHTDFPGEGKTETNIRGSRLWPQYAIKSGALFMVVFAVLAGLGGLVQINPIWLYGSYNPYTVSAGAQPDWYVGWLDGALRLWPHWEFRSFGHEINNPFFPGLLIPGIVFGLMFAWPFIDRLVYHDHEPHNLLDRPRDKPFRTAVGVAALAFFSDLTFASATDLLGNNLHISFERLIEVLQYGAFVAPIVAGGIAYKTCKALQRTGNHPIMKPVGGFIYRTADGAYHTVGEHHGHHGADGSTDGHLSEGTGHAVATNGHGGNGHDGDGDRASGNGHDGDGDQASGNGHDSAGSEGNGGGDGDTAEPVGGSQGSSSGEGRATPSPSTPGEPR
ncbi:MAG: cytochrome b, partial [Actinomycetes bacterium]